MWDVATAGRALQRLGFIPWPHDSHASGRRPHLGAPRALHISCSLWCPLWAEFLGRPSPLYSARVCDGDAECLPMCENSSRSGVSPELRADRAAAPCAHRLLRVFDYVRSVLLDAEGQVVARHHPSVRRRQWPCRRGLHSSTLANSAGACVLAASNQNICMCVYVFVFKSIYMCIYLYVHV